MKHVFLIFFISFVTILSAHAQCTDLVYSAEKNPEKGTSKYKLEILNNGNTANIGLGESVGFFCTLYDANKKIIVHTIVPTTFEIQAATMKYVFEINNDIVVFIVNANAGAPVLIRYIFDGFTGKLKKEEIVLSKPKRKIKLMSEAEYAYVIPSDFFIQKDPNSDYYALAYFDFYATSINEKIEVFHYSPTHEIISRAFLKNPEIKYLKLHYVNLYVNGEKSVIVSSYLYNVDYGNEKDGEACFYLSELKTESTSFNSVRAFETPFYKKAEAMFFFNKVTKKVLLLSTVYVKGKKGQSGDYAVISQALNLETLALTDAFNIYSEKINAAYKANASGLLDYYSGFPQHYSVNSKGNSIILSEILYNGVYQYLGVSCFTPTGQEVFGVYTNYLHRQSSLGMSFSYSRGLNGQYFSSFSETNLGLISGKSSSYLFLNNTMERFKLGDKDPAPWTPINSNSVNFTSFIYTIDDAGIASKEYIFGEPISILEKRYCRFNTADYDPATGLYAVIVVDDIKGKKTVSVLWMHLK
ncbi:hypothetical protein [uncultured Cytophaga sp.]|uniref:hypothetical protein n=1 Tax=uncultured Cytophaga sp. TaxID=160238 RepID=UPI0026251576|nr:hypothetical protein [uncultured Cytophaga sp.]